MSEYQWITFRTQPLIQESIAEMLIMVKHVVGIALLVSVSSLVLTWESLENVVPPPSVVVTWCDKCMLL